MSWSVLVQKCLVWCMECMLAGTYITDYDVCSLWNLFSGALCASLAVSSLSIFLSQCVVRPVSLESRPQTSIAPSYTQPQRPSIHTNLYTHQHTNHNNTLTAKQSRNTHTNLYTHQHTNHNSIPTAKTHIYIYITVYIILYTYTNHTTA